MTTEKQEKEFQDPGNFIYQTILASNKKIKKKKKKKKIINLYTTKLSITF